MCRHSRACAEPGGGEKQEVNADDDIPDELGRCAGVEIHPEEDKTVRQGLCHGDRPAFFAIFG